MNGAWRQQHRKPWAAHTAFSLVEVALALGIVGFCMIGMFGLFGFGLERSRQSNQNTAIVSATAQLVSLVRNDPTLLPSTTTPYLDRTYYFDGRGQKVDAATSSALYICHLTGSYVPETEFSGITPDPTKPTQTTLTRLTLAFTLPASAPAARRVSGGVYYATLPTPLPTP